MPFFTFLLFVPPHKGRDICLRLGGDLGRLLGLLVSTTAVLYFHFFVRFVRGNV